MRKAIVVLSGGQDSVTCLGWALQQFDSVEAIGFDYGQKHSVELRCAQDVCNKLSVKFTLIPVEALTAIGNSALIGDDGDVNADHTGKPGLPASFVPNRNAVFLTLAHAYAQKVGATELVTGVCQTDYSGYPDCREEFIDAMQVALNSGSDSAIDIHTPLMHLTKAETFKLAEDCDVLDVVILNSHTCYNGRRCIDDLHVWGYGCGECPACVLRAKGYEEYRNG